MPRKPIPARSSGQLPLRELNNNWRGGRSLASNGYMLIRIGIDHPLADVRGYAYEHRVVASEKIGRLVLPTEQVRHRNEIKTDNRPENLEVVASQAEHRVRHRKKDLGLRLPGMANPTILCACGCGTAFQRFDGNGRPRNYVSGHNDHPAPSLEKVAMVLSNGPIKVSQIISATGLSKNIVGTALSRLRKKGWAKPISHGIWVLTTEEQGGE